MLNFVGRSVSGMLDCVDLVREKHLLGCLFMWGFNNVIVSCLVEGLHWSCLSLE
jgi:hypothetical protein